jgi:hypothetical protein
MTACGWGDIVQIVRCGKCGAEIARVDVVTLQVYEIRAGDERPRARVDGKGEPVDKGRLMKIQPSFHLNDRRTIKKPLEEDKPGFPEGTMSAGEETVEEPYSITCGCGEVNLVF